MSPDLESALVDHPEVRDAVRAEVNRVTKHAKQLEGLCKQLASELSDAKHQTAKEIQSVRGDLKQFE